MTTWPHPVEAMTVEAAVQGGPAGDAAGGKDLQDKTLQLFADKIQKAEMKVPMSRKVFALPDCPS